MIEFLLNIDLRELFLPIVGDIRNINQMTNTSEVSMNNIDLASEENHKEYIEVLKKVETNRASEENSHNVIVM